MNFYGRCPGLDRSIDLALIRINKERDINTQATQTLTSRANFLKLASYVQSALSGELFALFRYQAEMRGTNFLGKAQHFFSHGTLEVHPRLQDLRNQAQITLLNMAPIFAQVQGNAAAPRLFGHNRRLYRVRINGSTGLTQRGHMIDIHAQQNWFAHHFSFAARKSSRLLSGRLPSKRASASLCTCLAAAAASGDEKSPASNCIRAEPLRIALPERLRLKPRSG